MAEFQGIKSLKLFKKNKQPLFPNDRTAGVDYETTNDKNILDEEGSYHEVDLDYEQQIHNAVDEYEYDDELLDEQEYEQMDQNEINDLLMKVNSLIQSLKTTTNLMLMLKKLKLRQWKSTLMTNLRRKLKKLQSQPEPGQPEPQSQLIG